MKKLIFIFAILFSTNIAFADTYTVAEVIDGDTLKLTNGEVVRMIGVEVPEGKKQEVKEFVQGLGLAGKEVRLEFDVQKKDKDGRLLAYVFFSVYGKNSLPPPVDGVLIYPLFSIITERYYGHSFGSFKGTYDVNLNAFIIQYGYARPVQFEPNLKYSQLFKKLYEEAKESKRGLWAE